MLDECYELYVIFVGSTFSARETKQAIYDKKRNPDQFQFLTHDHNWGQLCRKINQETGASIKIKVDIIQAKGQVWQNQLAQAMLERHV